MPVKEKIKESVLPGLVRAAREVAGLSQTAFARELNVSTQAVQNWEAGRRRPAPHFLRQMGELAPRLKERIEKELTGYVWHPKPRMRRYSAETIFEAHTALDAILDRARSDIVEKVLADLDKFAGHFTESKE